MIPQMAHKIPPFFQNHVIQGIEKVLSSALYWQTLSVETTGSSG